MTLLPRPARGRRSHLPAALAALVALVGGLFTPLASAQLPAGITLGPAIEVSTTPAVGPMAPRVESGADGNFLVAWIRDHTEEVVFRRFDAQGVAIDGSEQIVITDHLPDLVDLDVAVAPGGAFLFAWRENVDVSEGNILARRYAASGVPLGPTFDVSDQQARQWTLDVATEEGGAFAVIWRSTDDHGTFLSTFDAAGGPQLESYQLDEGAHPAETTQEPTLAYAGPDRLIAAWGLRTGSPLPDRVAKLAVVDPLTGPSSVTELEPVMYDDQRQPLLAPLAEGGFVVVWNQIVRFGTDPEWSLVRAQRLGPAGAPIGPVQPLGAFYATSVAGLPLPQRR